ncbi:MAG: ABC transporter ATP-binding protein [Candidatus Saccharimonadales bacterium]
MKKNSTDYIVRVSNLEKVYENGGLRYEALKNISFDIKAGEFVSIMGPSGSGKTTLLNQIGALDKPTSGDVWIDGLNISDYKEADLYEVRRQKIGFIFQSFYLVPTLSILENVLLPTLPLKNSADYVDRAKELLEQVGLSDRMSHRPNQLSGGQMQRVAIARALIMDPALVLADEPTGSLDSKTGAEIFHLLQELNKKGHTFLIVTHDHRISMATKRIIYLIDGKISTNPTVDLNSAF